MVLINRWQFFVQEILHVLIFKIIPAKLFQTIVKFVDKNKVIVNILIKQLIKFINKIYKNIIIYITVMMKRITRKLKITVFL